MKIEFKDKSMYNVRFGNLQIGDIFEHDNKLYLKIDFAQDDADNADAFDLIDNYTLHFEASTCVDGREFILKEV